VENEPAARVVERLIHEYGKLVFHTIYGLTGDWEESQDLTQETFQQALKSLDAARAKSGDRFHARAWLLQIAVNTVRMQQRRNRLFRFIPFSRLEKGQPAGPSANSLDTLDEQAVPTQPPGYSAPRQPDLENTIAERDAIQRTLQRISAPLRECLLLSIAGQFSSAEIAAILDIDEAAVRQRISRARKQFQEIYAQIGGEHLAEASSSPSSQSSPSSPTTSMSQNRFDVHHNHREGLESHFSRMLP
jgi:RNA polymerase sigma factor (sigma-70 family)